MGFHALFQREDVLQILQQTLQDYYGTRYPDKQISISYEKRPGAAEFFLIPRVGMIMQVNPGKEICDSFYASYHIRNNVIKHVAAKTLVFFGLHFPRLLAMKQRLYVYPREAVNSKTLFSYCNRSLRIFDYEKGVTVSIQKNGFTDKFFRNQLQFRLKSGYDFVPPVLDNGKDWFEEQIYTGRVLARITRTQSYADAQTQTLSYISRLQADSLENVPARAYIDGLCRRLETMLDSTQQCKATKHCAYARSYLQQLEGFVQDVPQTLPTVISHRDLQGGNVLVTPQKVWIIDWETQARGSRWFDAITMLYGTRYYGGIKKLLADVLADALPEQIGAADGWSAKQILALFLLEDLEFYLEDMLELPGTAGSATFDRYMEELQQIPWNTVF